MPNVSVIVAVYNAEKFLRRCLNSLLGQTYDDFEIICINDGSGDGSLDILNEYQQKDSRVRVISQKNQGAAAARNAGLDQATGKYVYFADADDMLHPQLLEICYAIAEKETVDMVCFKFFKMFDEVPLNLPSYDLADITVELTETPMKYFDKSSKFKMHSNLWTKFCRRDFIGELRMIPQQVVFEDATFTWALLLKNPRCALIIEKLYCYNKSNDGSISHGCWAEKHIADFYGGYRFLLPRYEVNNVLNKALFRKYGVATKLKTQLREIKKAKREKVSEEMEKLFAQELEFLENHKLFDMKSNRLDRYIKCKYYLRKYRNQLT